MSLLSMRSRVIQLSVLAGLVATGGCKKTDSNATSAGSASAPAEAGDSQVLATKINVYVACLNNMNPAVSQVRQTYLNWAENGPTLDRADAGIGSVTRESTYGYECFKKPPGLDAAASLPPKLDELDQAGATYRVALLAVIDVTQKANLYYEHKDYKDDKLARGKELHGQLLDAFAKFDAATRALEAAMEKIQDRTDVEELAALEKTDGKKAHWQQKNLMRSAVLLVRSAAGGEPVDPAKLAPVGDAYTKAFNEMKAWTDANKAEADKNVSWGNFVREADELLTQLKEMNRAFRDQTKLPPSGDGSVHKLIDKYNSLVTHSNDLWR